MKLSDVIAKMRENKDLDVDSELKDRWSVEQIIELETEMALRLPEQGKQFLLEYCIASVDKFCCFFTCSDSSQFIFQFMIIGK